MLILLLVGVLTGVTTVLFGFGGGFVTVPAVYLVVGASGGAGSMHCAVATSAAVMIVNAAMATIAGARRGLLSGGYLWPMTAYIVPGAAAGAWAATRAPEAWLRLLFVVYIAVTIVDGVVRSGFVNRPHGAHPPKPLSAAEAAWSGVMIGGVASFLGVGGSVLTVPLLRRKGIAMERATACANPLSLVVAIPATVVYAITGTGGHGAGQVGQINVVAAATLLAGSLPAVTLTRRMVSVKGIPDRVHAEMYLLMLGAVLIVMIAQMAG